MNGIEWDIREAVPRFLMEDPTGYALARAVEAGLRAFLTAAQAAVDTWGDPDKMPEWRLDELAWEYCIPYDHNADVEAKRAWIRNIHTMYRLYGTPEGVIQFMGGYFDTAEIEENWEYGGEPFHFRLIFPDEWTPEKIEWATKTIAQVKNVRSVLDQYTFHRDWSQALWTGLALTSDGEGAWSVPAETISGDWYTDENDDMLLDEDNILLTVEG